MDVQKCRAYIASIEGGSMNRAAQKLGYTPSGVMRLMDALEAEIGFPLLTRRKSGVWPTRDGKALLPYFREMVVAEDRLKQKASDIRGVVRGALTIGSYSSVAARWLAAIMGSFKSSHPDISISLKEAGNGQLRDSLHEGTVDLCFCSSRMADTDWIPLAHDQLVAWVPPRWPESSAAAFPLEAVQGRPFIMTTPGTQNDIQDLLDAYGIEPHITHATNDNYTAWTMVDAGLGMSGGNLPASDSWKGDVAVLPFEPPQEIELGIAVASLKKASPAAKCFIEFVQDRKDEFF